MSDAGFEYTVNMTRVSDGKTVEFTETHEGYPDYKREEGWECGPVFIWAAGNFSCDCNRYLFFERALSTSEEEIEARDPIRCGYSDYVVNWIRNDETGTIIYTETGAEASEL